MFYSNVPSRHKGAYCLVAGGASVALILAACQSHELKEGFAPPTQEADTTVSTTAGTPAAAVVIGGLTLSPTSATLAPAAQVKFRPLGWLPEGGDPITASVTWSATGGTITSDGLYTAGSVPGSYQVVAKSTTTPHVEAAPITITGTAAVIQSISVSPTSASVVAKATRQFSATATLSNGTTQTSPAVTWVATGGTISSGGMYIAGTTPGSYRVIASSSNGKKDTSAVSVVALDTTRLTLTPATVSLAPGQTQQFTVTATLNNGSTVSSPTVTWNATGGTITSAGQYTAGTTAGSYRVIASQVGGGVGDTSAVTILTSGTSPPPSGGGSYPNRPSTYSTVVSDYDFSENPPTTSADQPVGTKGWWMIGGGTSVVRRLSDASAPVSGPNVWEQTFAPGAGGENAAGIIYRNGTQVSGSKLYVSLWVWYSPGFEWNTTSQKLLYWEDGNILLQQDHNGVPLSMYIGAYDKVYDPNVCSIPPLSAFEGKWHQVEWQVERGSPGLLRVWLDGKLCSDYRVNVPTISRSAEFNLNSTWGGGGTRTRTSYRRVDHIFLARP